MKLIKWKNNQLVNHGAWKYALVRLGTSLHSKITNKFKDVSWLPAGARSVDNLTGLPILNNETRKVLIGEFSECIKITGNGHVSI